MPIGRGRLWERELGSPVQQVISCGLSGEGLNPFTAPSKWASPNANLVAGAASVAMITPPANKALRIYRYSLSMFNPAGFPYLVYISLGPTVIQFYSLPGATVQPYFREDFGPCGIAQAVGTALRASCGGFNVTIGLFVQYSYEPWGAVDDGN